MKKTFGILVLLFLCVLCLWRVQAAVIISADDVPEYAFSEEELTLLLARPISGQAEDAAVTFGKTKYTVHFDPEDTYRELPIELPALNKATQYTITVDNKQMAKITVLPVPHFTFTKGYACDNSGTEVKLMCKIDKASMLGNSKIYFDLRDEEGNLWDSKLFSANGTTRNFVFDIPQEKDGKKVFKVAVFLGDEQLSDWAPVYIKQNIQVLRRLDTSEKKKLVITVDCGAGGTEKTREWIGLLQKYDARATFFVTGKWANGHKEAVQAIYDAGYEIGIHTYSHPDMTTLDSLAKIYKEIDDGVEVVRSIIGEDYEPRLFRYPKGNWTYTLNTIIRDRGYELVQWTNAGGDSDDGGDVKKIIRKYKSLTPENGSIILFHNGSVALSRYNEVFDYFIDELGFELVGVGDLMPDGPYTIDENGVLREVESE